MIGNGHVRFLGEGVGATRTPLPDKGRHRYDSFTYPQSGFGLDGDRLYLSKIGSVRLRLSREIEGRIKTCTIKREADGWYVIFVAEQDRSPYYPRTGDAVGVDVGLENFATRSTGEVVENPRHLRAAESHLKTAQRKVSRRKRASLRRRTAAALLARQHQTVARRREDFHHKTALGLVREFDSIAFEDLNISGLLKNHHLAKAISDVGWNQFIEITTSKAECAGRRVMKVPAQDTSQDCSGCGARVRQSLAVREHRCIACGLVLHRDYVEYARQASSSRTRVASAAAPVKEQGSKTRPARFAAPPLVPRSDVLDWRPRFGWEAV